MISHLAHPLWHGFCCCPAPTAARTQQQFQTLANCGGLHLQHSTVDPDQPTSPFMCLFKLYSAAIREISAKDLDWLHPEMRLCPQPVSTRGHFSPKQQSPTWFPDKSDTPGALSE
jgi:hypothetical protein